MDQMTTANIALDIFSIILSLIPIVYLLSSQRYRSSMNRYFLGVAVSNIFMILGDLADWMLQSPDELWMKYVLLFFTSVFYVSSAFVLYFFAGYIAEYLKLTGRMRMGCRISVSIACAVQMIFALISPFTGSVFYVTDEGYQRGSLFIISQLVPLYCYMLFTILVIICRKKLKRREVVFFLLYIFVPLGGGAAQMFLRGIAVVNIGVALALLFILVNIQFEHEMALRQQEKELAEQRIDIMISQIQPHFLYNALGTIAHLCRHDPAGAEKTVEEFTQFLRGNMDSLKNRGPIPFEKELDHVRNYLFLERQRFQERLQIVYDIQARDFYIPPLSLQPLVENAVRHGILRKKEGGTITIHTEEMEEYAIVTITDDGVGMEKAKRYSELGEHTHIGIENVSHRIKTMVQGDLRIESSGQGTVVTLQIPLMGDYKYAFFDS